MATLEKGHQKVSTSTSITSDYSIFGMDTQSSWQNEMLIRMQKSAIPEPIKVACTVTPPGKPEYLGEEYHGTITREEEKKLLDGKTCRFLVRDSFTSNSVPDTYTLAFNYENAIQHIKLVYNTTTREFSTDSKKKGFKTVLELISDVLKLYSEIKRRELQGFTKPKNYNKAHTFKTHSYKHPKWCDVCGNFLWGLFNQGEKCEVCGINSHKACTDTAPLPCSINVTRRSSVPKDDDKASTLKLPVKQESSNYIYIPRKASIFNDCPYFSKCSRFLSAFNIRDSYIDMENNMTRCFCNDCIQETSNFNAGTVSSKHLEQWARFQFEPQIDPLKRNIGKWEVAYFAVNPNFVINLIKGFYNPDNEEEDLDVAPSLAYTTQDMENENWSYKFSNTETGGELFAQTVLEVYLRPDSFEIRPGTNIEFEPDNSNDSVILPEHWKVKTKKDLYPKSILVKIFEK